MRAITLTLMAIAGGTAAVAADLYLADKGYRIPDGIPLVGGMTIEPGLMGAAGAAVLATIVPPAAPLLVPLAIGATVFEGTKIAATKVVPQMGPAPQDTPPQVAGGSAFGLTAGPRGRRDISDADLDAAMMRMVA